MNSLNLVHLYPELMNLYGDKGNIIALSRRCAWRGIDLKIHEISLGDSLPKDMDIAFIGGGQDREQLRVYRDLEKKGDALKAMIADGLIVLAICGGYQLLGRRFVTYQGEEIQGLGILDIETVGGDSRLIGNVVADIRLGGEKMALVGFENHSGQTTLGQKAKPLGSVRLGFGNNGQDGSEGARQDNVFGTYLHGSLLPKNPVFADYLIQSALERKYGPGTVLEPLNDTMEMAAHAAAVERIEQLHRRRWVPGWFKR